MTDPGPEAPGPNLVDQTVLDGGEVTGRRLFRYLTGDEWLDYRAIMGTFAGTFFAEFTPEQVTENLRQQGRTLDETVVAQRLESLRGWGNLTVSSSVGSPSSLEDYYRRRNRYLITRAGQEVHDAAEGILTRVDEVRDVSTGRLKDLHDALAALHSEPVETLDHDRLASLLRAIFDPQTRFTNEITQFFAAINQWQSRYDLTPDEFRFFAEVLVGYVSERLDEVERLARPISRLLTDLRPRLPDLMQRTSADGQVQDLAGRVEAAGLHEAFAVSRTQGTALEDWVHLMEWFVSEPNTPSRILRLTRDAVAAIKTLTLNLTRLSRSGLSASSRRADFLRLAQLIDTTSPDDVHRVVAAALGLHPSNHYGVPAADADDPAGSATSWWDAPRATVPVSLRTRGDRSTRGRATPMPDRSLERRKIALDRAQHQAAKALVDQELLDLGELDGRHLSPAAMNRLQDLIARSIPGLQKPPPSRARADGTLRCEIERTPGIHTTIQTDAGTLTLLNLHVAISAVSPGAGQ